MTKRVVISGYGTVTPYGAGVSVLEKGLENGQNRVCSMTDWPHLQGLKSRVAAPVLLENEKDIPRKFRRSMSRMSIFAVQAADEALKMSGLERNVLESGRTGCVMGSTTGSPFAIEEAFEKIIRDQDISHLKSMVFFKGMSHTVTSNVSLYLGLKGTVMATSAACASSLQAVCTGYDLIRSGRQDVVFCGGAEELHPSVTASFDILEATSIDYSENPHLTPRPFDQNRDGLVCGEGAGVLILEEYEQALKRNAPVFCEIGGYHTNTSSVPITQSDAFSMSICMKGALKDAGISSGDVDYVNAHATGTPHGDKAEAEAACQVFGPDVCLSSLKGYIGHTLGASGTVETISSLIMMKNNVIYPCLNLDKIADDCNMISPLMEKKYLTINCFLKNAFAFGGINVSIIFRRICT